MRCLLDMDGVLADFVGGMVKAHGLAANPYDDPQWSGEYDVSRSFGMSLRKFWKPACKDFWKKLDKTPECLQIIELVEFLFGAENVCLLTSPSLETGSASGKFAWIYNNLPEYQRRFLIGAPKHFCAHGGSVLIDDSDRVVDKFREAGGYAVLYPRPWNSRHAEAGVGLESVASELRALYSAPVLAS